MRPRGTRVRRGIPDSASFLIWLSFAIGLPLAGSLQAGEASVSLPPSVVRALRIETPRTSVSASVEELDADDIRARNAQTLGQLLDGLASVRVQRYGGLGSLETLSVHGASAERVVVVQDGIRLNSPQHGLTDLSLWDGRGVGKAEVARGGYSAMYGADAMGGVIYLESLSSKDRPPFWFSTETGSFGLRGVRAGASGSARGGSGSIEAARLMAENDYPYDWYGETRRRWNTDAQQTAVRVRADVPTRSWRWVLNSQGTHRHAGTPGPDTGAPINESAPRIRQDDDDGFATIRAIRPGQTWRIEASGSVRGTYQRYHDPTIDIDSRHRVRSVTSSGQATRMLGPFRVAAGLDGELSTIRSTETKDGDRRHVGAYAICMASFGLGGGWSADADAALREDAFSDFGRAFSPRAGIVVGNGAFRLLANAGESFRAPTFNSLYWNPGGNPELQPEHADHHAVGVGWTRPTWSAEVTRLEARYRNQIRWLPDAGGKWSAQNVARSELSGWDAWAAARTGRWRARLRGSQSDAVQKDGSPATTPAYGKQIPFVARRMASAEVSYERSEFGFTARQRWVGQAFTRADNRAALPGYSIGDMGVWVRPRWMEGHWELRVDVDNVWNRRYVVMPQYPLPGRALRLAVSGSL